MPNSVFELDLYVDKTDIENSHIHFEKLNSLCTLFLDTGKYKINTIDASKEKLTKEGDKIIGVPTVVVKGSDKTRKFVGSYDGIVIMFETLMFKKESKKMLSHAGLTRIKLDSMRKVLSQIHDETSKFKQMLDHKERKKVILIAEDKKSFRNSMSKYLSDQGFHVIEAANGEDALAVLKKEGVDLIITDYNMPKMDGVTLLKEVKNSYPHIKNIIISGEISLDDISELIDFQKHNIVFFTEKPLDISEFTQNIKHVLK